LYFDEWVWLVSSAKKLSSSDVKSRSSEEKSCFSDGEMRSSGGKLHLKGCCQGFLQSIYEMGKAE